MSVLHSLHRVRKYHEHLARVEQREAERAALELEAQLQETHARMERASGDIAGEAEDIARRHAYLLQMEMRRRGEATQALEGRSKAAAAQAVVVERATESRVMERLIEVRAEAEHEELEIKNRHFLDEVGSVGWTRRQRRQP